MNMEGKLGVDVSMQIGQGKLTLKMSGDASLPNHVLLMSASAGLLAELLKLTNDEQTEANVHKALDGLQELMRGSGLGMAIIPIKGKHHEAKE